MTNIQEVVNYFFELKGIDNESKEFYKENKIVYSRYVKPAKDLLVLCDDNLEKAKKSLSFINEWARDNSLEWEIETAFKRWHTLNL